MTTTTPLLSVYDGHQVCIGFVLARGRQGFEAFDAAAERSLGLFETRDAAIGECIKQKAPAG
jgi:hypothetical protein